MNTRFFFIASAVIMIALFSVTDLNAQRTQKTTTDNTNVTIGGGYIFAPKWWTDLGFTPVYMGVNKNINIFKQTFGSANQKESRIVVIDGVPYKSTVHMAQSDGLPAVVEIGKKKNKKLYLVESFNHWGGPGHTLEVLKTDPNQPDEYRENVTILAKGVKNKHAQKTPPAAPTASSNAVASAPAVLAPERVANITKGKTSYNGGSIAFEVDGSVTATDGEVSFTYILSANGAKGEETLTYSIEGNTMTVHSKALGKTGTAKVPTTTSSALSVKWDDGSGVSTYQLAQ